MTSIESVNAIRRAELERIAQHLPRSGQLLELGAGSGQQASELAKLGFEVSAIDLPSSNYAQDRIFPVVDYDGRHIPFPDNSFDIVFSSNVLEHVTELEGLHAEIRRVLRPGGECIHVLPTHVWRFWTSAAAPPCAVRQLLRARSSREIWMATRRMARSVLQKRHGERGNLFSEAWYFHPRWWRKHFRSNGFTLMHDTPLGLFYTAEETFGPRLDLSRREALARWLGSVTHLYRLRPK
jgi:SAM-dependent methyltransferase